MINVTSVKHSYRMPITMVSPNRNTNRVVRYARVKVLTIGKGKNKYACGISWGLRYGTIRVNGEIRLVVSTMQSNGQYSQWELVH